MTQNIVAGMRPSRDVLVANRCNRGRAREGRQRTAKTTNRCNRGCDRSRRRRGQIRRVRAHHHCYSACHQLCCCTARHPRVQATIQDFERTDLEHREHRCRCMASPAQHAALRGFTAAEMTHELLGVGTAPRSCIAIVLRGPRRAQLGAESGSPQSLCCDNLRSPCFRRSPR